MINLEIALTKKQSEFDRAIDKYPVSFFGGSRGGGKSHGLRSICLKRRLQYPGSHAAIFRRSYPELEGNHIRPLLEQFPGLAPFFNWGKKLLELPNGSTIQFCHCASEDDVFLYHGREFHDLVIDEVGQWTEGMFQTLRGSNRSAKPGIKPRCYLSGTPAGLGHAWLKRLFIDRSFRPNERSEDYHFIPARIRDNPALIKNDPEYVHRLEAEPNEMLRRAYLEGSWDLAAGQFFSELRRSVHLLSKDAFKEKPSDPMVPPHWERWCGYDPGYNHPCSWLWLARDEDGTAYIYREFVRARQRVDQIAEHVKSFDDWDRVQFIEAGLDCWTKGREGGPSIADLFLRHDIRLHRAKTDRVRGAQIMRDKLAWQDMVDGREGPQLFIFETCPITWNCLTSLVYDESNVEDVMKVDAVEGDPRSGDDPYDAARYGVMALDIEMPKRDELEEEAERDDERFRRLKCSDPRTGY